MSYERCSKCYYSFGVSLCEYEKIHKKNGKFIEKLKDNINCVNFKNKSIGLDIANIDELSDLEIGTILDGLEMLKEHYFKMTNSQIKETLSGDYQKYLSTIEKLCCEFNIIAYEKGSVYINKK